MEEEGAGKFRIEISKGLFKRGEIKISLGNVIIFCKNLGEDFKPIFYLFFQEKKKGKIKINYSLVSIR